MTTTQETSTENTGNEQPTTGGAPVQTVTLTQDALNRMFAERVQQAERSTIRALGFDSADELKAVLDKARATDEANKTEAERIAAKLAKLEERATQAETERDAALTRAQETLIRAELKNAAAAAGFLDPADVMRFIDRSAITINEQGEVEGVETAIKELVKAKPYLVKADPTKQQAGRGTPTAPRPGGNKPEKPAPKSNFRL